MATNRIPVSTATVEAAKLRVKLNTKLGLPTSPVTLKIAAARPGQPPKQPGPTPRADEITFCGPPLRSPEGRLSAGRTRLRFIPSLV
jgi:hypothetical protein